MVLVFVGMSILHIYYFSKVRVFGAENLLTQF